MDLGSWGGAKDVVRRQIADINVQILAVAKSTNVGKGRLVFLSGNVGSRQQQVGPIGLRLRMNAFRLGHGLGTDQAGFGPGSAQDLFTLQVDLVGFGLR